MDFFQQLFNSKDFMPHGHCYYWTPSILWLHVVSDILIFLSYYSIPIALIYFVLKKKTLPFNWIFWMFGSFILLCGTTHIIDAWTTWSAEYRIEGLVKALTASVSVVTAIALWFLIPKALEMDKLKKSLISVTSHELRGPLSVILMGTENLLDGISEPLTKTQHEELKIVYDNVLYLSRLVDNMLDLSRYESGKAKMNKDSFYINDVVNKVVQDIQQRGSNSKIEMILSPENPQMFADKDMLERVLLNLLSNACRFAKEKVSVSCQKVDDKIEIIVTDDGLGIPPEEQSKLFNQYEQIKRPKGRSYKGTGLGLSICKEIIQLHGGKLWVESKPGEGAKFGFKIPLTQK